MLSGIVSLVVGTVGAIVAIVVGTVGSVVGIIVAIVAGILVPLLVLAVPLLLIMSVVWLLGLPSARRTRRAAPEETRLMQDINRGLARMENRLNSLETIMMDDDVRTHSVR